MLLFTFLDFELKDLELVCGLFFFLELL